MDSRPIGMFDSGVGGITVFEQVKNYLPNESIIYLGDTKRFPYGSKSKESIIQLTKNNIEILINKGVKIIVIACGTATSQALETIKDEYDIPIIGIIEPTVLELCNETNIRKIGVMATAGTIKSGAWKNAIMNKLPNVKVINKSCPLLAPMAEEGWIENEIAKLVIKEYISELKDVDKLILGCTHFPLFKNIIANEVKNTVDIIDTGLNVGKYLKKMLQEKKLANNTKENPIYKFFLTDIECQFINVAKRLIKDEKILKNNTFLCE